MNRQFARTLAFASATAMILLSLAARVRGECVDVPTVRTVPESGFLGEIESRLPASKIQQYPGNYDIVSRAHGAAHDLNSYIRNQHGGTDVVNACYLLGDNALVLPEPTQVTLNEIARLRTHARQGLSLDLSEPAVYWNRQPLYLLDELSAYVAGCAVGIETGNVDRARESLRFARDAYHHATTMSRLASVRGYVQAGELQYFLDQTNLFLEHLETDLKGG